MNFLSVLVTTVVLLAFAFLGLAIRIVIKKGGRFPNTHVSGNKHLRSKGIYCVQQYDRMEQEKVKKEMKYKNMRVAGSPANDNR